MRPGARASVTVESERLDQHQYGGQYGCRDQRLHVHDASLTTNLAALGRISDWLSTVVHVAQTARCERDSGFLSSLKETEQANPEGRKEYKSPTSGRSEAKEEASE